MHLNTFERKVGLIFVLAAFESSSVILPVHISLYVLSVNLPCLVKLPKGKRHSIVVVAGAQFNVLIGPPADVMGYTMFASPDCVS